MQDAGAGGPDTFREEGLYAKDLPPARHDSRDEVGGARIVVPHVARTIDSTVEAINAGLRSLKPGTGTLGKAAVIVDRDLVEGS
jgi:hypothetical protein